MSIEPSRQSDGGFTLIELIVFIVIVSVGLVGILSVLNVTVRGSADPMIRKQMLAVAEGLLEEVSLMPFTYCDPDDPSAASVSSTAGCTAGYIEIMGPNEPTANAESRNGTPQFDNVNDYNGLSNVSTGINGSNMPSGYSASVDVFAESLSGIPASESQRIKVTVTHGSETLQLEGYRTRHSPNFVP